MLGILCTNGKEKWSASRLHTILQNFEQESDNKAVIFTIFNIDFKDMMVSGTLVSKYGMKPIKIKMPYVIANMSQQCEKVDIKSLRNLAGLLDIRLINKVNKFDQWMIMEILSSSNNTKQYVLPYHLYERDKRDFKPRDEQSYIAIPARGTSMSRVLLAEVKPGSDRILGSMYFRKGHIRDYIDASMCQKRWVFMDIPEILTFNNMPSIVRVFVQIGEDGIPTILYRYFIPDYLERNRYIIEKTGEAALDIFKYTTNFIPELGNCFIDFVIDTKNRPFFLHLGGIDHHFLEMNIKSNILVSFYKNLLHQAEYYSRTQEGD